MPDYAQFAAVCLGFGLSPQGAGPGDPAALAASTALAAPDPVARGPTGAGGRRRP